MHSALGRGRSGTIFKTTLRGEVVALKICNLWQHPQYEREMINEVAIYRAFEDQQGLWVPRLKGAGYTAGGLFVVATEIACWPLEEVEILSYPERRAIQRALTFIHGYGFVHNGISKNNILINSSGSVFFIDFTFAALGSLKEFRRESKLLAGLLTSDV